MEFYKRQLYNSNNNLIFMLKPTYILHINEKDSTYVPRFSLKNNDIFNDFPTNTPLKYSDDLITKAIEWGMILQITYKGEEDTLQTGHERTIYPMVLGQSSKNKPLLRGYHLNGWSVSNGGNVEKEWRLFRADRILNIIFTGAFFRLAPDGYNEKNDKAMKKISAQADFNSIRNKQQILLQQDKIDLVDRIILNKIKEVYVKDLNYNFKLLNPWANNILPKKDAKNIRITFAKPIAGNGQYIAIVGASIEPNNIFKLNVNDTTTTSYKSIKWIMANELDKINIIQEQIEFKLYLYLKSK